MNAKDAAKLILKKAEELLKDKLEKAEGGHYKGAGKSKQNTKGIHKEAFGGYGSSEAGAWTHPKMDAQSKEYVKEKHKQVLGEIKAMPTPNLGKADGIKGLPQPPHPEAPKMEIPKAPTLPKPKMPSMGKAEKPLKSFIAKKMAKKAK